MLRIRALAVLLALAVAASGCGDADTSGRDGPTGAAERAPGEGDASIHLLTYSFLRANAEGVPCEPTRSPPLSAGARLRDQLVEDGDAAVLVLAGDATTYSRTVPRNRPGLDAAEARAEVIMEALGTAGVDLFVPGSGDFVHGILPLVDKAARHGVPVLATNVIVEGREDVVLAYRIIEHEGIRLACLGAVPNQTVDGRDFNAEPGVTVERPPVAVRRTARRIMRDGLADAVVLFSNLPSKLNQNLCGTEDLHFIVGSSEAQPADRIVQRDGTSMLNQRHMGRQLGHTTIRVVDGDWTLVDLSPLYVLPEQIAEEQRALARYQEELGTTDIEVIARRVLPAKPEDFLAKYTLMLENIEFVEEYSQWEGSAIEHRPATLPVVAPDNAVDAVLEHQGPAIEAALDALGGDGEPIDHATAGVLRPQDCIRCHEEQYEFWAATAHAGAHDLLAEGQRQRDPSCLVCHAAGFGIRGGYNDPRVGAPFGGVTCFNCHSPYRPHVESRRLVVDSLYVKSDAELLGCVDCHTPRRSPGFDREALLPEVTCPPMRPDDPVLQQVWEEVLVAVERQRQMGTATDRDLYCEGKALVGLGREDEGFERLLRYAASNTTAPAVAFELADYFDERGRSEGALEILREFLEYAPSDLAMNERYADLLVHATEPGARDPELAISHINLVMPPDTPLDEGKALRLRLTLVDAYFAAGREHEGRALLQGLDSALPDNDDIYESLVRHGIVQP